MTVLAAGCGESGSGRDSAEAGNDAATAGGAATGTANSPKKIRARREARQEARRRAVAKRTRARRAARANRSAARPSGDLDCGDFSNQAQAQKRLAGGDPYGLDGDGDGLACTSLPCPCSKARPKPGSRPAPALPAAVAFRGVVESVADGDTIDVRTASGREETIRLIGIDTPEVYGGVECGGRAASSAMKRIARGAVTVRADPTQDRRDHYGRLLAYVDKGRVDLGRTMVSRGLASVYVFDENFRRLPGYRRSQRAARSRGRGSWPDCDLSPG